MNYVIRLVGLADGRPTAQDGRMVARFAFQGRAGEMVLETTLDPRRALKFNSVVEAVDAWKSVDPRYPTRANGKPNRPLTAYTVTVEPMEVTSEVELRRLR